MMPTETLIPGKWIAVTKQDTVWAIPQHEGRTSHRQFSAKYVLLRYLAAGQEIKMRKLENGLYRCTLLDEQTHPTDYFFVVRLTSQNVSKYQALNQEETKYGF